MAIRMIRTKEDNILYKKCKEVKVFDKKLSILLDDMYDTMKNENGVGLAAPQVGILKRAIVIETDEKNGRIELINPVIISEEGEQDGTEGCLSVPGIWGKVSRPMKVVVRAQDRTGEFFEISGDDLLARAFCHEIEHLDGHLFLEKVTEFVDREDEE
ncbi:MAG: peptide deformylase [Oscillospiraceae bacterium]|nr:peptide deformylase [Oscillospiraceae bacterium]